MGGSEALAGGMVPIAKVKLRFHSANKHETQISNPA
jgi:hypothetical protein